MLEVLSTNRDLKGELKEAEKMLIELDRTQMPSYELGYEQGHEEGREEGREQERWSVARKLIEMGQLDDQAIAQAVGLPLERVQALRHEFQADD